MRFWLANRVVVLIVVAAGLDTCLLVPQHAKAANLTWSGSAGATWDITSNNWNGSTVATPWDSTNGTADSAVFNTAGASANAAGNLLNFNNLTFTTTGGSISGGTLNMFGNSLAVSTSSQTTSISSAIALNAATTTISSTNATVPILLSGIISGTGNLTVNTAGSASCTFSGSADSIGGILIQGAGNHNTIAIAPGASFSANEFYVNNFGTLSVNGNMSCGTLYSNASAAGDQFLNGSGTISTNFVVSNHGGNVRFSNGQLFDSGPFWLGLTAPIGGLGTSGAGGIITQSSGTVSMTGGIDSVLLGFNGTSTYNAQGGLLSIPNTALVLGYSTTNATVSTFNQTGGLANLYGLSMGTTQTLGAQNGKCAITVTGGTLNLGAGGIVSGGTGTHTVTLGKATIGALAPWSTSQPITLNSTNNTTFNTTGGSITLAGVLSGSGGLTANGSGTLLLGNANGYTGGTTVSGGTLLLGVSNALPTGGNYTVLPGGTLDLGGNGQTTSGTVSFQGGTVQNGTLTGVAADFDGQSGTVTASLAGGIALDKTTGGTLVLSNSNNSYTNGTNISGGALQLGIANALPTGGNITVYTSGTFDLGGLSQSTAGVVSLQGGTVQNGTLTSAVSDFDGQSGTVTATLAGGVGLSKTTSGLLTLGGNSSYSGSTNVISGALAVNGSLTGIGGVAVQSGGTLAGTGLVSGGGVSLLSGAVLSPGPNPLPGSVGTFTASSLAIGDRATIGFDLSTSNTGAGNDVINVTGNLSLPTNATILVNPTGGSLSQAGAYTLFNYGSLTFSGSPLVYSGPLGARQTETINYGTGSNSSITLSITGAFANLIWSGAGTNANTWDQNNTGNLSWSTSQPAAPNYFASLDNVRFDATSTAGHQTVTLEFNSGNPLTPTSVTVTGTKNYTFAGAGQIGGATALTVVGPGSLTIQNAGNSYTGGTNIQGGSIILGVPNGLSTAGTVSLGAATSNGTLDLAGNNQALGGLAVAPVANASHQIITNSVGSSTLTYAGSGSSTFGGTITDTSPTGVLALEVSSGQLALSGSSNNYAGGTTVNGGTLQLAVSNALPTSGNITALPGGTLDLGASIMGSGGQTTSGTVSFQGGTVQNGTLTSSAAAFDGQGGTVSANLAGPVALNKTTGGVLVVSSSNSNFTGGTNIFGGVLQLGSVNALPTGGNISIYPAGTFDLGGLSQTTSGIVSFQGGTVQNGTLNSTASAYDGQSGTVNANLTGGVGLNMSTTGLLTLGGSDNYTGNTVVNSGTLQLGSAAGIPSGATSGNLVLNAGASSAGVVDINGIAANVGGLSGTAGAVLGMIVNNSFAGGTLSVGSNNASTTFSGMLADGNSTLALNKSGTSNLTLDGSNTYSGGTTVTQGILAPTNSAALGTISVSSSLSVKSGGELQLPSGILFSVGNVLVAGSGVTGPGAINGGTLSVLGANITANSSSGTAVIGSPTVLTAGSTVLTATNGSAFLSFSGPFTTSGDITTSGSGNFVFGGGSANVSGTIHEGNSNASRTADIIVQPGTTLSCGTWTAGFFSSLTVNGTLNATVVQPANSNAGIQFFDGKGVINTSSFVGSNNGTVEFSKGVLNVSGSAIIGRIDTGGGARSFQQDSGTVNVTSTGDGFTVGVNGTSATGAYTMLGGVLNVPNEYVELCYSSGTALTALQVLGATNTAATANVYGVSLGQTVNNGVQNGNGLLKLGNTGSRLVIGAGGIVESGSGSQQVLLGSGTLASSAPWSTMAPLTLSGTAASNIDASAGTISLSGSISGAGGLREIGSGFVMLSGTNAYSGGTTVVGGTLIATNSQAIADGTSLTVGSAAAFPSPIVPFAPAPAVVAPVPEPSTFALLATCGAAALLLARRRRKPRLR